MYRSRWAVALFCVPLVVAAAAVACGGAASAAPTDPGESGTGAFASSFEPGEPAPDWRDTVETGPDGAPRSGGVDGSVQVGLPGSLREHVTGIAVNAEPNPDENGANLNDADPATKWLVDTPTSWARYTLDSPARVVRYALTSANDAPERDPRDWTVEGSADGTTWTTVDTRTGQSFDQRFQTHTYEVATPGSFAVYRLSITGHPSGSLTQLADWQIATEDTTTPPATNMQSRVGGGPASSPTAKANVGYTGRNAFLIGGRHLTGGRAYAYNKVFDVNLTVTADTELSYLVFPEFNRDDLSNPATYTAVDLAFTDGTYLSDLKATDQHGVVLSPAAQGAAKTLYTQQWNQRTARIGAVAAGRIVDRILVGYDKPAGPTSFRAWFDDIALRVAPPAPPRAHLSEYADTRRGTQSSGDYSRGNNFPATAVPHGFNFWTPVTDAGTTSWLYEYHRDNNAANRPTIQAFSASHQPSPWMGDRQTFQVMPSPATGVPDAGRANRALAFGHDNEVARPYYYGVTFDNGMKTEIAPTDHAALMRFTFTGNRGNLILDNVNGNAGLSIDAANRSVSGWSDVNSGGLSAGWTRMFMYAVADRPVAASGSLSSGNRPSTGYLAFDTSTQKTVTLRIATSLISVAQARHNLELELAASATVESVRDAAQRQWDTRMHTVEVEGASEDQLVTLYSNLYRLFLYPNSGYENTGSAEAPVYRHAVQSSTTTPASSPTETGAPVKDGKVYVNNGFWDTYRTTWPAYALLTPGEAGEMVDGFVQQYRDGGWISRWSAPGYANLMVGTSSDVAFADAFRKGVTVDAETAYRAALRNATVTPPNANVGRKGLATSIFKGYTPSDATGEAMSWAMDGYINDFGIAGMAAELAKRGGPKASEYAEQAEYFRNRAQNYVHMFDESVKFFQGRDSGGTWRLPADRYDPRVWGYDYTETDGWNMAFHVPHDGQGLANLYGGRDALAKKLDTFFATPETAGFPGSYGGTIHEMLEARDVRLGQYGHSNQPSHHIIYMYDYAGQPAKAQALVREALSRLYLGSEIGQGYPGDEDNGEMSAWYVFSALGFYPLQMGSPAYAIGSPLFTKATVNLENGRKIVVNARNNSARNVYVQSLTVNGQPYTSTSLPHALLAGGATLDFTMGDRPSDWGTGADAAPPSLTTGSAAPDPLRDLAAPGKGTATDPTLVDDTTATRAVFGSATPAWQYQFTGAGERAEFYTLTSGAVAGDPTGWRLRGSYDGTRWTTIDERSAQSFEWRLQTRPFKIATPGTYRYYRLEVTGNTGQPSTTLAEVELLGHPAPVCSTTIADRVVGALSVHSGVTCLRGATVTGLISVRDGASLYATDANLRAALTATDAGTVSLQHTTVTGPVTATGATAVSIEDSTVSGPVSLLRNRGTTLISGNTIGGALTCTGNHPAPVDNGLDNTVSGPRRGQCATL
ncbi:putative alpha-1,2-mannosidase [Krasilnikovia cinnamomea]|uniref:Putative alpha-1,2-mannosidase n=1 Tax=Krasilnikovia cinnamomea TaxID=349313 RepID=A0A4Q7ZEX6_9ACTN|nr:GH92 family glycosyl hydrolase [Krasilnikovia cinnamomea]RZU49302.1 putative alpha-1,2-mannosidase [Krasilnikovia cinnamomea]